MEYSEKTITAFDQALTEETEANESASTIIGHAGNQPGQGPYVEIHLTVEAGIICDANYKTYGCPACVACASTIVKLAKGISIEEAEKITSQDVTEHVGKLPRAKRHCLAYSIGALRDALEKTKTISN